MRLVAMQPLLLAVVPVLASSAEHLDSPNLYSEVASLVSAYVPQPVYAQLTASVAAAASAASVTGDPASLFLSAILATNPPAWFSSAVPSYFSSNIDALEAAVSTIRSGALMQPTFSSSETTIVTKTTDSLGSTITTSFTSTLPTSAPKVTSSFTNAAVPIVGAMHQAGIGAAALVLGLAAVL